MALITCKHFNVLCIYVPGSHIISIHARKVNDKRMRNEHSVSGLFVFLDCSTDDLVVPLHQENNCDIMRSGIISGVSRVVEIPGHLYTKLVLQP